MKKISAYLLAAIIIIAIGGYEFLRTSDNSKQNSSTSAIEAPKYPSNRSNNTQDTSTNKLTELKVHIIDIGQGDSILVQSDSENILIDGGNKGKGNKILEYLDEQGVKKLDAVVSTHPDADHIGGLSEFIRGIQIGRVYAPKVTHTTEAYKQFLLAVKERSLKINIAKNGVTIPTKAEGLNLSFIGPTREYNKSDLNDWSAVLQVTHGSKKFLLTGDAEIPAEKDMIKAGVLQKVDVLKVSHHGAAEASSEDFLNIVKPNLAVISVGKGNRYKHPTAEALHRLEQTGAKIYRTDKHGNIVFISNGKNIIVKVER